MERILIKVILSLLLFSITGYGQNQLDNYYYYKGEKVFLDIDTKTISISFEGENSINSLKNNSNEISEIIEDRTRAIVDVIGNSAKQRKNIKAYYVEISAKRELTKKEYVSKIENFKKYNNTLMVSPTYKTKVGKRIGLSNNFHVKLKKAKDVDILFKYAKEFNVEVLGNNEFMPLWFTLAIRTPQNFNALNLANIFYETGLFENTEPVFMHHDLLNSNDPYFNDQWMLKNTGQSGGVSGIDMNIEQAWGISTGNNIKIAVIDEGIELNHPDLAGNSYGTGYDASLDETPSIVWGPHGTACAGIIGAVKDNNNGIAGVAPNSKLISISLWLFTTTSQTLANGINWAWQNGADVISNSWGGLAPSSVLDDAISNALTNGRNGLGSIVVFSSGNDNENGAAYPSNSNPLILCVGATDRCGVRSGRIDIIPQSCDPWGPNSRAGSSYGTPLDIVAGGTSISTTDRQGDAPGPVLLIGGDYNPPSHSSNDYSNYDYTRGFGGTSAACPYVAGVAALILSTNPDLTVKSVNDIIEKSAQKIRTDLYSYSNTSIRPNGTWNNELGYGMVDAHQAVLLAQNSDCIGNLTITQNVNIGQSDIREVTNSITATNIIFNNATAVYDAGNRVRLRPGFHARMRSSFRAHINGCVIRAPTIEKKAEPEVIVVYEKSISKPLDEFQKIKIFPNPVRNILTIISEEPILSWELKNNMGKLSNQSKPNRKTFLKDHINVKSLNSGLYILKINMTNGETAYKRIIKN
ncbi:S8 family serine peptidase [Aquimarina sp. AU58]|uniref:S8 family serine peptidase n=1 Tax=Aquimarina sp. AU58 TaxID=1874112 RepID=UPI000D65DC7A|nr:S8 family serine peptidase [Aquimarina sp. AU58]